MSSAASENTRSEGFAGFPGCQLRKLPLQCSGVSVGSRLPLRPATLGPPKVRLLPTIQTVPVFPCFRRGFPALIRRRYPSNPPLLPSLTVLVFGTSRRFPALALRPRQRLRSIPSFGSFRRFRWLTPPHRHSFGSFRHRFGKAPLTETASAFSVCSSVPSGLGNRRGREDEDQVGQGKGYGEGAGSRLRTPVSPGGESAGKEGPISWMA